MVDMIAVKRRVDVSTAKFVRAAVRQIFCTFFVVQSAAASESEDDDDIEDEGDDDEETDTDVAELVDSGDDDDGSDENKGDVERGDDAVGDGEDESMNAEDDEDSTGPAKHAAASVKKKRRLQAKPIASTPAPQAATAPSSSRAARIAARASTLPPPSSTKLRASKGASSSSSSSSSSPLPPPLRNLQAPTEEQARAQAILATLNACIDFPDPLLLKPHLAGERNETAYRKQPNERSRLEPVFDSSGSMWPSGMSSGSLNDASRPRYCKFQADVDASADQRDRSVKMRMLASSLFQYGKKRSTDQSNSTASHGAQVRSH